MGKISIGNGLKWNFIWWFYTKFKLIMRNDIKINTSASAKEISVSIIALK